MHNVDPQAYATAVAVWKAHRVGTDWLARDSTCPFTLTDSGSDTDRHGDGKDKDACARHAASADSWSEKAAERTAATCEADDASDATPTKWFIQNSMRTNKDTEKNSSNDACARM